MTQTDERDPATPRDLWDAADRITKPRRVPLERCADPDLLAELANPGTGYCDIASYRAVTQRYATLPSLWDQAVEAMYGGEHALDDRGNRPLRERSPADLDLIETMATIRETLAAQLDGRQLVPHRTVPAQIRQLAAHVATNEPEHIDWWAYRFNGWARLLTNYLHAAEHTAKPVRLRSTPCPLCRTRQVTIDQDGEQVVAPPIVIDFRDGYVRAARCDACTATWWRGPELEALAAHVNPDIATSIDTVEGRTA